jgi:hypothetical protein
MTDGEKDNLPLFSVEHKTKITPTRKPLVSDEETIRQMEAAEEMERSIADFVKAWKDFDGLRADTTTENGRAGIRWWDSFQWLALADYHLKELFIQGDRSPRSIELYHKYRLRIIAGRHYRTEA